MEDKLPEHEKQMRDYAALSYIPLLGQIIYFSHKKESALITFHGRQGLVIAIIAILFWYFFSAYLFLELILLPLIIIGIIYAEQGRFAPLPIVHTIATGQIPWKKIWTTIKGIFAKFHKKKDKKEGVEEDENIVMVEKKEHGQLRTHENVPDTKEVPKNIDF